MLIDHFRLAYGEIASNKIEVTLTAAGLIVGIAAVMIILTLGQGAEILIKRNFSAYKPYVLKIDYTPIEHVKSDEESDGGPVNAEEISADDFGDFGDVSGGFGQGFSDLTSESDRKNARFEVPESDQTAPLHLTKLYQDWHFNPYVIDAAILETDIVSANLHDVEDRFPVVYCSANLGQFLKPSLAYGRWFSDFEVSEMQPVAVLQIPIQEFANYVEDGGVVGQHVGVGSNRFKVIGAMAGEETTIYLPYTFYSSLQTNAASTHFLVRFEETRSLDTAFKGAMKWMKKFGYNGEYVQESDMTGQILKLLEYLPKFTFLMSFVAGISLFVGGLGVMNTVLSSVIKRTREIGIRKAIGAPKWSIILQFIMETVLISMGGGIIGVGVGFLISLFILRVFQVPIFIPFAAMAICVGVTLCIGVLSGIVPAVKAASLDPIDAIGHS